MDHPFEFYQFCYARGESKDAANVTFLRTTDRAAKPIGK